VESENASEIIFFVEPGPHPFLDIVAVLHRGEQNTNIIVLETDSGQDGLRNSRVADKSLRGET